MTKMKGRWLFYFKNDMEADEKIKNLFSYIGEERKELVQVVKQQSCIFVWFEDCYNEYYIKREGERLIKELKLDNYRDDYVYFKLNNNNTNKKWLYRLGIDKVEKVKDDNIVKDKEDKGWLSYFFGNKKCNDDDIGFWFFFFNSDYYEKISDKIKKLNIDYSTNLKNTCMFIKYSNSYDKDYIMKEGLKLIEGLKLEIKKDNYYFYYKTNNQLIGGKGEYLYRIKLEKNSK